MASGLLPRLRKAHVQALTAVRMQPMESISISSSSSSSSSSTAQAAAALHRQQQPAVGGSQVHTSIPDRLPAKSLQTQKYIPRPPYELKTKFLFVKFGVKK